MSEYDRDEARKFHLNASTGISNIHPYGLCLGWAWEDGHVLVLVWNRGDHPGRERLEYDSLDDCVGDLDNGLGSIWWSDPPPVIYEGFRPLIWEPKRSGYADKKRPAPPA